MGRKRTTNKKKLLVSVDNDLFLRLKALEVNRSLLFTEAAEKYLEMVENENKSKNIEK